VREGFWRGMIAIISIATFGGGWTLGFLLGRIDGILYIAGIAPLVSGVSTFYFVNETKNGQLDKLLREKAKDV